MRRARVSHRVCVCSYRPAPIHSPRTTTIALTVTLTLVVTVPDKESVESDKNVCGRRLPPLPEPAPCTQTRLRVLIKKLEKELDPDS